ADLSRCVAFPALVSEPISLALAQRAADELRSTNVRSILLVSDGFRSRRVVIVYSEVLRPFGIEVHCQPVFASRSTSDWYQSLHGIQEVGLQFGKLLYYR